MNLLRAFEILDIGENASEDWIKIQFKWLAKFYHPDNSETGDRKEFEKVVSAYNLIQGYHGK